MTLRLMLHWLCPCSQRAETVDSGMHGARTLVLCLPNMSKTSIKHAMRDTQWKPSHTAIHPFVYRTIAQRATRPSVWN